MASHRSAEEVEASNIAAMGPELGKLFTVLGTELTWLAWRWGEYCALFATKPTRLDLVNSAAPFFFWIVQETLWHETLLGISRLAGPPRTMGKENLSLRRLPALLQEPVLQATVEAKIANLDATTAFAKDWRNRHIAHRDLELAVGQQAKPLPLASKDDVDNAISRMSEILDSVEMHFHKSTTLYQHGYSSPEGAEALLFVLRDGLRREELRQKKLDETGVYDAIDWNDDLPAV